MEHLSNSNQPTVKCLVNMAYDGMYITYAYQDILTPLQQTLRPFINTGAISLSEINS